MQANLEMAFHPEPGGASLSHRPCCRCPTPRRSALDPGSLLLLPCTSALAATLGGSDQRDKQKRKMGTFWGMLKEHNTSWREERFYREFTGGKKGTVQLNGATLNYITRYTHPENSRLGRKSSDCFVQVALVSAVAPSRSKSFAADVVRKIGHFGPG